MELNSTERMMNEIMQLGQDIRAEVVLAQLLKHTRDKLQVIIHTDDYFYRQYSKDITRADISDSPDLKEILNIHISRTGLYDILPEGLFFKPLSVVKAPKNAVEMAEEYKTNKKQELEIRKFFSPLENEFFYHRYKNFGAEASLLQGINNDFLNRHFMKFWQLPEDMPRGMVLRMVLLFPYIHQITGDPELMAASLEAILDEQVSCRIVTKTSQLTGIDHNVLGKFELGNGLACGNEYDEEEFIFEFTIFDLQRSSATDYLEKGRLFSTMLTFYRFFVPVAAGTRTVIKLNKAKENMHIGFGDEALLGITTVL